ncbi:hypothetical protein MJ575_16425 [Klebsiella pneumoniae]|nr:hypothetical protein MJ575_16425 [Klebsiella pneumoniae]
MSIPPLAPWWMVVPPARAAVVHCRSSCTGTGRALQLANQLLLVLLISFPVRMTSAAFL